MNDLICDGKMVDSIRPYFLLQDSVTSSESASTATAGEATIQPLSTAGVNNVCEYHEYISVAL